MHFRCRINKGDNQGQLDSPSSSSSSKFSLPFDISAIIDSQSEPFEVGQIRVVLPLNCIKKLSTDGSTDCINLESLFEPNNFSSKSSRILKRRLILGRDVVALPLSYAKTLFSHIDIQPQCDRYLDTMCPLICIGIVYLRADPPPNGLNIIDFIDFHCNHLTAVVSKDKNIDKPFMLVGKLLLKDIIPLIVNQCNISRPNHYRIRVNFIYNNCNVRMILTGRENIPLEQITFENITLDKMSVEKMEKFNSRVNANKQSILELWSSESVQRESLAVALVDKQRWLSIPQWFMQSVVDYYNGREQRIGSVPPAISWPGANVFVSDRLWTLLCNTFGFCGPRPSRTLT